MTDRDFLNSQNYGQFCNSNEHLLKKDPKGIVIEFPGLGGSSCLGGSINAGPYNGRTAEKYAEAGIILIYGFPGPWSYMCDGAVRTSEMLLDAVIERYALPADVPVVACGGSMGGLGCLTFTAKSRHNIVAVMAACPVTDMLSQFERRPDIRRYYITAAASMNMPLEDAFKSMSPYYLLDRMPDVDYYITSDGKDFIAIPEVVADFAAELRKRGRKVEYHNQENLEHGWFEPGEWEKYTDFIVKAICG